MNILTINILVPIIIFVIGYLFGSIPNAVWIGKVFYHKDPRDYGSHNAGATNVGRLFGKPAGMAVIVLDIMKTFIPMYGFWAILTYVKINGTVLMPKAIDILNNNVSDYIIQWPVYWFAPLGAMIGHCWPIFSKFRGGKAVTVYYTALIGASWLLGAIPFIFVYLGMLKLKKYVSLSAIVTSIFYSVFAWIWVILSMTGVLSPNVANIVSYFGTLCFTWQYAILITLGAILVILRHKSNMKRLKLGTESKITWMK